jgi:hypothetical protein
VEEAQSTVEIDVTDKEATEDDVVWSDDEVEEAMDLDHFPVNGNEHGEDEEDAENVEVVKKDKEWKEADCRIIVNVSRPLLSSWHGVEGTHTRQLEVQIYTHILRDRIEWDLSSSLQPSQFATQYCRDLGLTGEAIPLITVAIHEELLKHKKDALELELFAATHPEAQAKWEKAPGGAPRVNRREGARALVGVWRDWWEREEYGPVLVESMEEMERREMERTREARWVMGLRRTSAIADTSQADDENSGDGQEEAIVSTAVSWAMCCAHHDMQRFVPRGSDTPILWSGHVTLAKTPGIGTQHSTHTSPRFGLVSRCLSSSLGLDRTLVARGWGLGLNRRLIDLRMRLRGVHRTRVRPASSNR